MQSRIVPSVRPADLSTGQVGREFRRLLADGGRLRPAGEARNDPPGLLARGYTPKYKVELFETTYYLTNIRQNPHLRFFVGYVLQGSPAKRRRDIYPRIFYKDVSLVWRSASHYVPSENWIGKGDVKPAHVDGEEILTSAEETTDLPLEIQTALEILSRRTPSVRTDHVALSLVLRNGPEGRLEPYRDFTDPRRRAGADRRNLVNGGRSVARFTRRNDPGSLVFVAGFEPDLERGIIETGRSTSVLYGGQLRRFRVLSRNRKIQYQFFAGPRHVWIVPAQATTTEIMSYGVRTIDVIADEDLFLPGYEYHYLDDTEDPPVFVSQVPPGFAGPPCAVDGSRVSTAPWLDRLPVIREFRKQVLERGVRS